MSSEYFGTIANPPTEYAELDKYNKQSQFGPRLPPTVPIQNHPTVLEQSNKYGYDVLSYGTPNSGYYDVAQAYGNSCNPKFYVRECPSNKIISPFVPDITNMANSKQVGVKNQLISEGFQNFHSDLRSIAPIHLFIDQKCSYCQQALKMIEPYKNYFVTHDIANPVELKLLTEKDGYGVPYFYAANGNSATGLWNLDDLMKALKTKLPPKPTTMNPTTTGKPMDPVELELSKLNITIYTMNGCHFCNKLHSRFESSGYKKYVRFEDGLSPQNRAKTSGARGFPYIVSASTGKTMEGDADILNIIQKLK